MLMGQPHARNQIQGTLPHGRQRSSMFEGCSSGSFYYFLWMDLLAGAQLKWLTDSIKYGKYCYTDK